MGYTIKAPQAVILGTPTYLKIVSINILTPQLGLDDIVVTWNTYSSPNDTKPLETYSTGMSSDDIAILMSIIPANGVNLYDTIKTAAYAFLKSKGLIPTGTIT